MAIIINKNSWWHNCIGNAGDGVYLPDTKEICPDCGAQKAKHKV